MPSGAIGDPGGDHTLFTTAAGIETLWELTQPVLDDPTSSQSYSLPA